MIIGWVNFMMQYEKLLKLEYLEAFILFDTDNLWLISLCLLYILFMEFGRMTWVRR